MGNTPDGYGWIGYSDSDPVLCEFAHADHITGLQVFYGAAQRLAGRLGSLRAATRVPDSGRHHG